VFVQAPADGAHRARLRIFTPARELAFAGHPTVGTAVLLGLQDEAAEGTELVLEEKIGPVRCTLGAMGGGRGRARFAIPQLPVEAGAAPDGAAIAAALGLAPADIGFGRFRPARWSAGNAFTFVPVSGLAVIGRCRPDPGRFEAAFGAAGMVYVLCGEAAAPGHDYHARMFAPGIGLPEDPASGSAVAAFAGMLAQVLSLSDGQHAVAVEQGYEMGRPSLIGLTLAMHGGKLVSASIDGDAVIVTQGSIEA
jgi:trans-2,3-dihydro-3-hydroxyanthranilate isomerase